MRVVSNGNAYCYFHAIICHESKQCSRIGVIRPWYKHLTFSSLCAFFLPETFTAHSADNSNLEFQGDGTKCRQFVHGISQMNFLYQLIFKADFCYGHGYVCVCVHVCDLEVFMAVMIIIRLGIYMVLSPFKVPLSKKNLKGTFLSPSSFHSSRSHIFTNSGESLWPF